MITRQEAKEVAKILLVVVPLFALLLVVWQRGFIVQQSLQAERTHIQSWLMQPYLYDDYSDSQTRQRLMVKYELTEDDVNIDKVLEKVKR